MKKVLSFLGGWGRRKQNLKQIGGGGERAAARRLTALGYRIVERNVRAPWGEIDLVALDGETLVFCEVKTRRGDAAGSPDEAIDPRKQARIARLAEGYLLARPALAECECRFDAALVTKRWSGWKVEVVKDAFQIGW